MLYGIRTGEQYRLAKAGYRVQTLIAYGEHWYPWYMRRLAERPANVAFAIRSDAAVAGGREPMQTRRPRWAPSAPRAPSRSAPAPARSRRRADRSIHLQIGEPDFDTPANVREAAKRALDDGATHYAPFAGHPGPARGDRRRRHGAQGLRGRRRTRSSSRSAARA